MRCPACFLALRPRHGILPRMDGHFWTQRMSQTISCSRLPLQRIEPPRYFPDSPKSRTIVLRQCGETRTYRHIHPCVRSDIEPFRHYQVTVRRRGATAVSASPRLQVNQPSGRSGRLFRRLLVPFQSCLSAASRGTWSKQLACMGTCDPSMQLYCRSHANAPRINRYQLRKH